MLMWYNLNERRHTARNVKTELRGTPDQIERM